MNIKKIRYLLHSGKNNKMLYYMRGFIRTHLPVWYMQLRRKHLLNEATKRDDYDYILRRVNYYNRLVKGQTAVCHALWQEKSVKTGLQPMTRQKVYFLDSLEYARCFSPANRWHLLGGDITFVDDVPSIVKSRPIHGDNANSVVMKLDKVRHFIFIKDKLAFRDKCDRAIFRGKVGSKDIRMLFMEKYFGNPRFDAGAVDNIRPEWKCEKISIYDHLKYKYILALEGNDVASNLKWVMSSNSLAVMPRPTFETWFMEGTLIPGYHYVEVKPDLSDIEEKMDYYTSHPDEAEAIIRHAHEYVDQFRDRRREEIISLLVLEKYFDAAENI
ncbi:MAG TPA: lipopolysaccharide biosynthesis protein [Porphyromonadaceae bacterium]|nr:lipopolysaccharide biosynthesis protein [Porphyromonadaceae bacterium]